MLLKNHPPDRKLIRSNLLKVVNPLSPWIKNCVSQNWSPLTFGQSKSFCSTLNPSRGPFLGSPETFLGPDKSFVKLRPAYSAKLVFWYDVKGIKNKIMAKFCASRRLRFEDTERLMSLEMRPKKFRDFRDTGPRSWFSNKLFALTKSENLVIV